MNRVVFVSLTILCLLFVSSTTGFIHLAKADGGTIYINPDGSITPSTAPIYTVDKVTYTLTGDITSTADGIVIERNNIVLNGMGYTLNGSARDTLTNGITLTNRSNVTVNNMTIENFNYGISLYSSTNCTVSGNNATANKAHGIFLESSSGNTLSGNNVTVNDYNGFFLGSSSSNTLSGNNIANSGVGIWLDSSSDNNVTSANNITANTQYGIWLEASSGNTVSGNNAANNNYGIELELSSNNFIFLNNFANNTNQAYTQDGLANVWDNGSMGNYWSDYQTKHPNATQVDSSGVWNTPYVIDTNNTDHYPLIVQYVIPEFPSLIILPLFMMATLLTVIIYRKKGMKTSQS